MNLTLDAAAFRAWLLAQDEGAVVGVATSACLCPLASYLSQRDGGVYSVVGNYCTVRVGEGFEVLRLPAWAEAFVLQVDVMHGNDVPVLREEALAALNRVLVGGA